jgi:hypothetical protein
MTEKKNKTKRKKKRKERKEKALTSLGFPLAYTGVSVVVATVKCINS